MKKVALLFMMGFLLAACTYGSRSGAVQKGDEAFFSFKGDLLNVSVVIDEGTPFSLDPEDADEDGQRYSPGTLFKVSAGKHMLKVYRNDALIVNRVVYLGAGETKEIDL